MSDFDSTVNIKCLAPLGASDHAVILADLPICPYKEPNTSRVVWRYNQADWGRLRAFFRDFDWSSAITDSPEQSCTNITSTIQNGMQWFIPSRKLLSRPTDPAWWTPECTEAASVKQHAWRRFDKAATVENRVNAKIATDACKSVLKTAKDARLRTLRNKLSTGNMSDRSWWSTVRQAGGSCQNSSIPTLKGQSGSEYTTNAQKAECFGEFFASKCSLGAADFPDNLPKENFPHVKPRTMDKLSTVHFRRVNVRKELRRLNTAKASGPDDIPAHVLKSCADELSHPLTKLFSLCFRKQIQPYQWKCARAVPVYKKKSKSLPQNYRPVSLLSIISKVMESIVNRQLLNFLESRGVLSPRQFGFRKGLSTTDLLMKLYHEWAAAAASGGSAHVLAIDIAGAIDKVSHAGLLHKASVYGLDGALHGWLSSYLTGRSIHAVVGGQSSSSSEITSGVPQGSILGPTLFILYTNDCEDVLPDGTGLGTYADDTTMYQCLSTNDSILCSAAQLQTAVNAVAQWGDTWKIRFEPSKCQALTVDHHRPPRNLPPIMSVAEESEIKLLGVIFYKQLLFSKHLQAVATKANQRLHLLYKAAPLLGSSGRATVYKAFVRPIMEYCCLPWIGAPSVCLDRVQRKALHIIGHGAWLPSLQHRRTVAGLTFLYKLHCLPNNSPLKTLLPAQPTIRPAVLHPTRLSSALAKCHPFTLSHGLPIRSRRSVRNAFPACVIPVWNSLPQFLLSRPPQPQHMQQFKTNVHRYLLKSNWNTATDAL